MIFLGIILLSLGSLPFIYVDITISSPGKIHAGIKPQILYSPSTGSVVYSQIKAYGKVKAGDTLLILDTHAKKTRWLMLKYQKNENALAIKDLNALIAFYTKPERKQQIDLKLPVYISEHKYFSRKQDHHHMELKKVSDDHERVKHLFLSEVVPKTDYEMARHALEQEKASTEAILLQQLSNWQHDLSLRISEQTRITADIQRLEEEIARCYLIAPVSGTIINSADIQVGSQLLGNNPVAELSPEGKLFVTAFVSPADIGYLFCGQEVRVAVDAYNYNLWGLLDTSITDISDDVITDPISNTPYYHIRCRLPVDSLVHKNGSSAYLKKGMTVNCRMIKTRESLFQLLANKLDHLFNPANRKRDNYTGTEF